ncbi:MAG: hypothetical protein CMB47_03055 [Euryarchaeota archaeon]|nr:hypothetical protein [Euryarchaeota archaeon]|tara:strand:- start:6729 stop:6965 length:237 start_codon:yes stop_codon:yes gene_type:complete
MVEQDTIGWICSFIVISLLIITVIYEVVKRWRLSLRLVALDESLLNDNSIIMEELIDAPDGSKIVQKMPAYLISDEEL